MKVLGSATLIGALALASSVAFAFQEQKVGSGQPGAGPGAAVTESAPAVITPGAAGQPGTEIRIPGLGKLGVIPKLDFGLELLYGAGSTDTKQKLPDQTEQDDSQVLIRGTVKRKF